MTPGVAICDVGRAAKRAADSYALSRGLADALDVSISRRSRDAWPQTAVRMGPKEVGLPLPARDARALRGRSTRGLASPHPRVRRATSRSQASS